MIKGNNWLKSNELTGGPWDDRTSSSWKRLRASVRDPAASKKLTKFLLLQHCYCISAVVSSISFSLSPYFSLSHPLPPGHYKPSDRAARAIDGPAGRYRPLANDCPNTQAQVEPSVISHHRQVHNKYNYTIISNYIILFFVVPTAYTHHVTRNDNIDYWNKLYAFSRIELAITPSALLHLFRSEQRACAEEMLELHILFVLQK